jgi:hypothetical protein
MKTIIHVIDTTGPGGAETIFFDLASRSPAENIALSWSSVARAGSTRSYKGVASNPLSWTPRDLLTGVFSPG